MGYASRSHAVGEAGEKAILPGGGILRPTICVDGRFVGTWSRKNAKKKVTVTLEPFDRLDEDWLLALEAEAADIARFDGFAESDRRPLGIILAAFNKVIPERNQEHERRNP